MKDRALRAIALWIAALAGVLDLASIVVPSLKPMIVPAAYFVAAVLLLLGLRISGGYYLDGFNLTYRAMYGDDPMHPRKIRLFDPEWGVWGSKAGTPVLVGVRGTLYVGAIPIALTMKWQGTPTVMLWWAAGALAIVLSMMHMAIAAQEGKL